MYEDGFTFNIDLENECACYGNQKYGSLGGDSFISDFYLSLDII